MTPQQPLEGDLENTISLVPEKGIRAEVLVEDRTLCHSTGKTPELLPRSGQSNAGSGTVVVA